MAMSSAAVIVLPSLLLLLLLLHLACAASFAAAVPTLPVDVVAPTSYVQLATSGQSTLFSAQLPPPSSLNASDGYTTPVLVAHLQGPRERIGYDYAALLSAQSSAVLSAFLHSVVGDAVGIALLNTFIDWVWREFQAPQCEARFLAELAGMRRFYAENPDVAEATEVHADVVAQRFFVLANMPADAQNIVAALEYQLEPASWPAWLKNDINAIVAWIEKAVHHKCDAFGVWGSRTDAAQLFSSRNLDYAADTGINKAKLVTFYTVLADNYDEDERQRVAAQRVAERRRRHHAARHRRHAPQQHNTAAIIVDADADADADADTLALRPAIVGGTYAVIGFAFGMGALAGMSQSGVTVSEMNLDNSRVKFAGLPFPLRLRLVLEEASDLETAMVAWNATSNSNSFNFLIASAADAARAHTDTSHSAAFALETERGFTAQFGANSGVEAAAVVNCSDAAMHCHKWAPGRSGEVHIGRPMPEAVWRSNHGFHPEIVATQEPLFNNTVTRYNLMAELFTGYERAGVAIADADAINIAAILGTKGADYYTCDQNLSRGINIMSIAYMPGARTSPSTSRFGHFYVAWESGSGATWRPAACAPYVRFDLDEWVV